MKLSKEDMRFLEEYSNEKFAQITERAFMGAFLEAFRSPLCTLKVIEAITKPRVEIEDIGDITSYIGASMCYKFFGETNKK